MENGGIEKEEAPKTDEKKSIRNKGRLWKKELSFKEQDKII